MAFRWYLTHRKSCQWWQRQPRYIPFVIVLCNSLFFLQFDSQVLELDEVDFVDEAPSFFETTPPQTGE